MARRDAIRRALGNSGGGGSQLRGGGQGHDVVGDDDDGRQLHHVVAQFDDVSGGQRHHWSARKRQRRGDDSAMSVRVDQRIRVEAAMGPDHSTRVTTTLSPVLAITSTKIKLSQPIQLRFS